MRGIEARAFYRPWNDDIGVFLIARLENGKRGVAGQLTFREVEEGMPYQDQTFVMSSEYAQRLMDDLWGAGLRPTQGKQSEGVTAAQGRHLEDMRAIAFAKLKVASPSPKTPPT